MKTIMLVLLTATVLPAVLVPGASSTLTPTAGSLTPCQKKFQVPAGIGVIVSDPINAAVIIGVEGSACNGARLFAFTKLDNGQLHRVNRLAQVARLGHWKFVMRIGKSTDQSGKYYENVIVRVTPTCRDAIQSGPLDVRSLPAGCPDVERPTPCPFPEGALTSSPWVKKFCLQHPV